MKFLKLLFSGQIGQKGHFFSLFQPSALIKKRLFIYKELVNRKYLSNLSNLSRNNNNIKLINEIPRKI